MKTNERTWMAEGKELAKTSISSLGEGRYGEIINGEFRRKGN